MSDIFENFCKLDKRTQIQNMIDIGRQLGKIKDEIDAERNKMNLSRNKKRLRSIDDDWQS